MKNNDFVKNIASSVLQQIVIIICGFIAPRLIIAAYGSEVNGMVASITQFLGYITLLEAGIAPVVKAALYKPIVNLEREKIEKILKAAESFFRMIAMFFIFYLIILCIVFPQLYSGQYSYMYTISLIIIIAVSTFFEYFFGMTYNIYLQSIQKNYVVSIVKIISKICNTIAIVVLVLNGSSIQIVKLASSIIFIISPLVLNFYVKKKFDIQLSKIKEKAVLENKWAGFSQHIAAIIHGSVDIAVLTVFSNALEVSVYSVYMLVINSIKELAISLSSGIDAWFGKALAKKENGKLSQNLRLYEFFYFSIITFLFACTFALQLPFVKVYTNGIHDVNYIRPAFAYIMIMAQLIMAIRVPYTNIVLSAGHFKQTEKGAWIEAILNIVISIILVYRYGIIGVAIGTFIATLFRTVELIIYSSKKILNRKVLYIVKGILIMLFEIVVIFFVTRVLPFNFGDTYWNLLKNAVLIAIIAISTIAIGNYFGYHKEIKECMAYIRQRRAKKDE